MKIGSPAGLAITGGVVALVGAAVALGLAADRRRDADQERRLAELPPAIRDAVVGANETYRSVRGSH